MMCILSQHSIACVTLLYLLSQLTVIDFSGRCHKKYYHSNGTSKILFTVGSSDS